MTQSTLKAIAVRAAHTFWQAFLSVFGLGIFGVTSSVLSTHDFSTARSALIALVVAAVSAGLSALKNTFVKPVEAK